MIAAGARHFARACRQQRGQKKGAAAACGGAQHLLHSKPLRYTTSQSNALPIVYGCMNDRLFGIAS